MFKSVIVAFGLLIGTVCAANAQITFQKSYGLPNLSSDAYDVLEIPGGYLLAGGATDPNTGWDGLLMQLDAAGNVVWEKTYDLEGAEKFKSVISDVNGGYVVLGESQTSADIWVIKVDGGGNLLWQFRIDRPNGGSSGDRIMSVPGGFVLSGTTGPNNGISHGYLARYDANVQAQWATTYQTPLNNLLTIGLLTDSLWYASGIVGLDATVIAVNPVSGAMIKNMHFAATGSETFSHMAPTPDGHFILSGFAQPLWPASANYLPWVQKISPAGEVIWSHIYHLQGQSNLNGALTAIPGGGYLMCLGSGNNDPQQDAFLMKIGEDGQVSWCHPYGNPDNHDWFLKVLPTVDGGFIAVGLTGAAVPGRTNVYVVKLNAEGELLDCCQKNTPVTLENYPSNPINVTFTPGPFFNRSPAFGVSAAGNNPAHSMLCASPAPMVDIQRSLCPGETIMLNGEAFSAPDTVSVTLPDAAGGCDTLATYYLVDASIGQPNLIQMQCPANIVRTLPAGSSSISVDYALPAATTNCTCDGLVLEYVSGGLSGSQFTPGDHQVCWLAKDACGNDKTCCFTISIMEEANACDEKSNGCFTWELLDRKLTADDEVAYRFRVTNHCASGLKYAWFEVPSGVSALEPAQNSVYAPNPARQYQVRNPNFSPFYSVRFQALSNSLHSGQAEIFRVVLPKQSQPDYLLAAARLENGTYAEAHLNTFDCSIGQEKGSADRGLTELGQSTRITLSPNPLKAGSPLRLNSARPLNGRIQVLNSVGQLVFQGTVVENQVEGDTGLLSSGICLFRVFEADNTAIWSGVLMVVGR